MIHRRNFLFAMAAPAIVHIGNIMPVRSLRTYPHFVGYDIARDGWWVERWIANHPTTLFIPSHVIKARGLSNFCPSPIEHGLSNLVTACVSFTDI